MWLHSAGAHTLRAWGFSLCKVVESGLLCVLLQACGPVAAWRSSGASYGGDFSDASAAHLGSTFMWCLVPVLLCTAQTGLQSRRV